MATGCVNCARGFHDECKKGCGKCHPDPLVIEAAVSSKRKSHKDNIKDPQSTGRKRAAVLYPMNKEDYCEWRRKSNCGGGRIPIVGCVDGRQKHRHHGPVKDTLRNELGNVHRICSTCHVRWHELNDPIYNEADFNKLPHSPSEATLEELAENELKWSNGDMAREFTLKGSLKGDKAGRTED